MSHLDSLWTSSGVLNVFCISTSKEKSQCSFAELHCEDNCEPSWAKKLPKLRIRFGAHSVMEGAFLNPVSCVTRGTFACTGKEVCCRSSRFVQSPVEVTRSSLTLQEPQYVHQIRMKKGRFHAPLRPKRQDQLKLPQDGTPIFAIFVRTTRAKIWYPLGAVQGDARSKTLVDALKGRFARALYENALDRGIAQTVYGKDSTRFLQNAVKMYPQLKRYQKELEFGYRVMAIGLDGQKTKAVTRDMALPFFAWAKKRLDDAINSAKK